jgi:hypothetical protein
MSSLCMRMSDRGQRTRKCHHELRIVPDFGTSLGQVILVSNAASAPESAQVNGLVSHIFFEDSKIPTCGVKYIFHTMSHSEDVHGQDMFCSDAFHQC